MTRLAIDGGEPVRRTMLPYGKQSIDDADVEAVVAALRSDWLTTGPRVAELEDAFARVAGARHAVAVSSGTAALHAGLYGLGIGPGDEIIVPALTFVASANAAVYLGATPVFADVSDDTLLLGVAQIEAVVTPKTRAIVAVDYAGQPCDYERIVGWAKARGIHVLADACHSVGGSQNGRPVGSLADASAFSFHPVKTMTTGEGGMITTDRDDVADRARVFRNHGITTDHRQRESLGTWSYDMVALGHNLRLPDTACALGTSQLRKLPEFLARRTAIASRYQAAFVGAGAWVRPLAVRSDVTHGHHLYVVRVRRDRIRVDRAKAFAALRAEGIGVNVHYRPAHLHSYYQKTFGLRAGLCPVAESAYEELLSLPLFPAMSDADVDDVIAAVAKVGEVYACD